MPESKETHVVVGFSQRQHSCTHFDNADEARKCFEALCETTDFVAWVAYDQDGFHTVEYGPSGLYYYKEGA